MDGLEDESSISLTVEQRIARAIAKLPTLSAEEVSRGDSCPICLTPFTSILDGPTQDEGVLDDVAPNPIKLCGVTKLDGCGHVFCKADLIEWIRGRHGTCPACRHIFLDVRPPTDSDNESSDGSDYVPDDDDEDEDDGFVDTEMTGSANQRWISTLGMNSTTKRKWMRTRGKITITIWITV